MRYFRCMVVMYLFSSLIVAQALACSPADKLAYQKLATAFCTFLQHDQAPPHALFTHSLIKDITDAERKNAKIAAAEPTEKPPLGDGVPYQSFPDHAPVCQPGTNVHVDHQIYIEVQHLFPNEPKANWTDRLHLVKTEQGWRIDDILYAPDYTDGLREALTELFAN